MAKAIYVIGFFFVNWSNFSKYISITSSDIAVDL